MTVVEEASDRDRGLLGSVQRALRVLDVVSMAEEGVTAKVIARNKVVGVINVQHRQAHQHTGSEMEVLTTIGEQVGCALALARLSSLPLETLNPAELVLSGKT